MRTLEEILISVKCNFYKEEGYYTIFGDLNLSNLNLKTLPEADRLIVSGKLNLNGNLFDNLDFLPKSCFLIDISNNPNLPPSLQKVTNRLTLEIYRLNLQN